MNIKLKAPLKGEAKVPGDKSITHRAIIFSSLAEGRSVIHQPLLGADCLSTIDVFRRLGVTITVGAEQVIIESRGWQQFEEPVQALYTGNSGTTTRLLAGVMSGLPFRTILSGDASIGRRPMKRIIDPLTQMGARVSGSRHNTRTPLVIEPARIQGIHYTLPVASAQVKSAVLLAGLFAEAPVTVIENVRTRNHTETMLPVYGVPVKVEDKAITLGSRAIGQLHASDFTVPGDISSAAFLMVAALITPGSDITLHDVGINETRDGIIEVINKMGGAIEVDKQTTTGEPTAAIRIRYTENLKPLTIEGELIPRLIDELPVIALLMTQAAGTSVIKDAEELKVKETNRIDAVVEELSNLGFRLTATTDGMIIRSGRDHRQNAADSRGDHRIGMMLAVASLLLDEPVHIDGFDSIAVSFPDFMEMMERLGA
ncbi:3-phosphoshikimate 1-carboxyvinyltransferase [Macrococcus equipercicus]|uniref:3-phosphoshikimate 1-carboxyvinyltransferase n=1 Tax=Macrococcus equipercicus TaxID=69967 RepID=A0A9Q9F0H8_9STAP|nr:3-phosphoshikimate 1-carboxyvinyltransferase [Macrococcus equipercicus]KAA1040188.1 3-phosphoshikimate 1-carboxyvinyltransferase [Macrococcus equipercicus]UTH12867.1 3-phosphoshikimate 1-carboxyvinyltransferase [Macrococcus equipercicus]